MTYLFIDGGYLRAKFKKCMERYHDEEVPLSISENALALRTFTYPIPEKTFYYDCVDEREIDNESDAQFAARVKEQEDVFNSIRELPGWHVREGRLVGARRNNRTQKRVDVLLAVEMLSHAFNKNMRRAVLIAGDDDFTPLVEELLRHGTYVQVWSDLRFNSMHLMHTADAGERMGYSFYRNLTPGWFREKHPLPDAGGSHLLEGGRPVEYGNCDRGEKVTIAEAEGLFHFCTPQQNGKVSRVRARELRTLHAFLEDEFPERDLIPKDWKPFVPRRREVE